MKTRIYKGLYSKSWQAETNEAFELNGRKAELKLSTSKQSSGLTVTSSIGWISADGLSVTHALFSDFFHRLEVSKARCTEKAITELHNKHLATWAQIKQSAISHYNK